MAQTTVSRSNEIFYGSGVRSGNPRPAPLTPARILLSLGSPVAADADGYAAAQAVAAAGNLTLDGALAGVADVPRNVVITSAGDDSGITFTVTGTDIYNHALTETITGADTAAASGKKAFKRVTQIAASAAAAGNVSAGTGDVLGLPYAAISAAQVPAVWFNDAVDGSATIVKAVTSTASATTGDVRGTVDPDSACDGSVVQVEMYPDPSSAETLYGVAQT